MSVGSSSKNYFGLLIPARGATVLFIASLSLALTSCLGDGGGSGNPKCDPQPYDKVITPISYQNGKTAYFSINDFDFLWTPNLVVESVTLQGAAEGHHQDSDKDDDFDMDVNGTKTSRHDGDRHVHWMCGTASAPGGGTPFCTPLQNFSLNGGLSILDFMLRVQLQHGNLRMGFAGSGNNKVSNLSLVVHGEIHPTQCKPNPPPPPPPVAPTTTITAENPSASPTSSSTMSISFSADQTGVQFACSLDNATAVACTSPQLYSNLMSGPHTFSVKATNASGLSDANPPSYAWTVDTQPPEVTITNAATLPTITNATTISVAFSANEASTFQCALDAQTAQTCSSPFAPTGLSEGAHTISISAVDDVGNVSQNPATYQWTVDLTPPTSTINLVAPAAAINNSSTMTFQFSASETGSFACAVDGGTYTDCQSPYTLNNVAEGSHWFNVRATDVAGNQGASVSYSWKADFTAPVITLGNVIPAAGATNAHNISVDFSTSEPATVTCSFDGAAPASCTTPFTAPVSSEGPHSLVITATDVAGNATAPTEIDWNMDFTAPILSLGTITPSAAAYINSPNISLQILASKTVTMSASLNGNDLGPITSPLQLTNLADGAYTVVISAVDTVGNPADNLSYSFNVDTTAPVLTASAEITGLTNLDHNTLTFSASEQSTFMCNIDEAGFAACQSPLSLSGLADGAHTAVVHAVDVAGNVSADSTMQWTVDTTPPVTTVQTAQNSLTSYTFTLSSNEANSTFQCSMDGAAFQTCTSPVTESGLSPGSHSFVAEAIDLAGNVDRVGASSNFTIIIPTTTMSESRTTNADITFTLSTNVANPTFTCSLDGAAETACSSPTQLTGLAAGSHTFLARAHDAMGNGDPAGASYTWTVNPPIATMITAENPTAAITNSTTMTVSFSANQTATFKCSLDGSAAADCTSPVTYSNLSNATHTFIVKAVDSFGTIDAAGANYSWTVDTIPPSLVTISTSSTTGSITVNWTTNELSTTKLLWGKSPATDQTVPDDGVFATSHSVHITGLSPNTVYTVRPAGTDRAGNAFLGGTFSVRTGH